ncbi:hypothetical protein PO878_10195 [Iamia majanohamensis]|uniref:Uncharacterized protein n=1 Tax=Iamia majanohamensis TaxID=467976 RepID=A0AAE9Y8M8_9ACTN|nr:hypothetical protein [Iamia majanohamensis]WCO69095.1 hypothetical protein PO878_10195 [Iamia majanohamensis]
MTTIGDEPAWPEDFPVLGDGNVEEGLVVLSRSGNIEGRTSGSRRPCATRSCDGWSIGVQWETGQMMHPCSKGWTFNPLTKSVRITHGEISGRDPELSHDTQPAPRNEWPSRDELLRRSGRKDCLLREPVQSENEPERPEPRWKRRAYVAGGVALVTAVAVGVVAYLKQLAEQSDEDDLDDDYDSAFADEDDDDDWVVDQDLADYLDEQEEIVARLIVEVETLDEDEWQGLYDQLDLDHQMKASDDLAEWADDAVGHPSWRSDE